MVKVSTVDIKSAGRTIVHIADLPHAEGKIHFIFGESGIGKSLTAKAVCGLLDSSVFDIRINGLEYSDYKGSNGRVLADGFYVFQEPSTHLNPLMRIKHQMGEGNLEGSDYTAIAAELFPGQSFDPIRELFPRPYRPSGGEKQRVLLAMALQKMDRRVKGDGGLFVFDEPTSSLDEELRDRVIDQLVARHRKRAFNAWVITHDYSIVSYLMRRHKRQRKSFVFSEFYRDNEVHVRPFNPDDFTKWLGEVKSGTVFPDSDPVLTVKSDFRVHGLDLNIVRANGEGSGFQLSAGQWAYLKGPSGIGKTSFAKAIMGLAPTDGLRVELKGLTLDSSTPRNVWKERVWGKSMSMVFQLSDEALNPQATVRQVLDGAPIPNRTHLNKLLNEAFAVPEKMFSRPVHSLSGGEKQRLNLVRTLALETDVVILDEPFSGVDFRTMQRILSWIEEQRRAGQTFIVISHQEEIFDALVPATQVFRIRRA